VPFSAAVVRKWLQGDCGDAEFLGFARDAFLKSSAPSFADTCERLNDRRKRLEGWEAQYDNAEKRAAAVEAFQSEQLLRLTQHLGDAAGFDGFIREIQAKDRQRRLKEIEQQIEEFIQSDGALQQDEAAAVYTAARNKGIAAQETEQLIVAVCERRGARIEREPPWAEIKRTVDAFLRTSGRLERSTLILLYGLAARSGFSPSELDNYLQQHCPGRFTLPQLALRAVESLRLPAEAVLAASLSEVPEFAQLSQSLPLPEPGQLRRQLIGRSQAITEGMAPALYERAREAQERLGLAGVLEIYRAGGAENADLHRPQDPLLVEVPGRLLTLLDRGASLALFGHELGHALAHGPQLSHASPQRVALSLLQNDQCSGATLKLAARLAMAMELTSDRFALLATQDLDDFVRLELISTTGLPGEILTWDTKVHLQQCREGIERALAGDPSAAELTPPEHSLRTWAAWLFSETDVYCALTGKGPGTRPLEEVNETLSRVLNSTDLAGGHHMLQEPPREQHEVALACSVLVASADGDFAETEQAVIERIFAPLVPDWRSFLDIESAQERLEEAAIVVQRAGRVHLRALFQVLIHVMAVDGVVDAAEFAMIRAIGESLGCTAICESLLAPALHQLGGPAKSIVTEPPAIELPPRLGEREDALHCFLSGFARRKRGETSLRQILRILGEPRRTAQALDEVQEELQRNHLTVAPPLATAGLDDTLTVTLVTPTASPPRRTTTPPRRGIFEGSPEKQRLMKALSRLRDLLITGDGRSPAVRLHEARPGRAFDLASLDVLSRGLSERVLALVSDGQRAQLVTAAESGRQSEGYRLASELEQLLREHLARQEETGAHDLFLGTHFLTGNASGYLVRGPLILAPVALEKNARGAPGYSLMPSRTDPPIANQALIRLLFRKLGFEAPEDLFAQFDDMAADPDRGVSELLQSLSQVGIPRARVQRGIMPLRHRAEEVGGWKEGRFEIEECAVVGLFPQSSSDLLHDYDGLFADLQKPDVDLTRLLGCARELLGDDLRALLPDPGPLGSARANAPVVPVIEADPSQREVLTKARGLRAMVVDGPPGTGKSQVIVNLVADAVGRGERVAVVSEKRAALDVVAQRLESVGLRQASALVHDVFLDRKELYAQIARRLAQSTWQTSDASAQQALQREVEQSTRSLDDRLASMRRVPPGTSLTVGELFALVASLSEPVLLDAESLSGLDELTLLRYADLLVPLRSAREIVEPTSPWSLVGERQRKSLGALRDSEVNAFEAPLNAAVETARRLDASSAAVTLPPAALVPAAGALDAASASRAVRHPAEDAVFAHLLTGGPHWSHGFEDVARDWSAHAEALRRTPQIMEESGETLARLTGKELAALDSQLGAALETGRRLEASAAAQPVTPAALATARPALEAALAAQQARRSGEDVVFHRLLTSGSDPGWQPELQDVARDWATNRQALSRDHQLVVFQPPATLDETLQELFARAGSFWRFFSPAWWSARSALRAALALAWPARSRDAVNLQLLQGVRDRLSASRSWAKLLHLAERLGLEPLRPGETVAAAEWLERLVALTPFATRLVAFRRELAAIQADLPTEDSFPSWDATIQGRAGCLDDYQRHLDSSRAVVAVFPWLGAAPPTEWLRALRAWVKLAKALDGVQLRKWIPSRVDTAMEFVARLAVLGPAASRVASFESRLRGTGAWPAGVDDLADWDALVEKQRVCIVDYQKHLAAAAPLTTIFPWLGACPPAADVSQVRTAWRRDALRIAEADRQLAAAVEILPGTLHLLEHLVRECPSASAGHWRNVLTKTWAEGLIRRAQETGESSPAGERAQASRLGQLLQRSTSLERTRLAAQLDGTPLLREPARERGARKSATQATREALAHEVRKQRRLMPLRTLVRTFAGSGLLDVLPVWLLSPETTAVLFPREPLFDLVIFDEASQCTVENGLPVLLRGARVVIAGDEKQMPPTSFFSSSRPDEGGSPLEDNEIDLLDSESLLTLARMRVEHTGLQWHYRCKEEELIAFSNHSMYEGDLLTIPSTSTREVPSALRWMTVTGGTYDSGTNLIEAERVVDVLGELLCDKPDRTIGIVTFNISQRKAVLDEIEQRLLADGEFAEAYGRAMARERQDERPFVKNLENVQGDERDVIIFSLGHTPVERKLKNGKRELYVPARFGPLGQRGGERRLNVAISRAKEQCIVVSSFSPDMLTTQSTHKGPRMFKAFLEYAWNESTGGRMQAQQVLDRVRGFGLSSAADRVPAFEAYVSLKGQIADALRKKGIRCEVDVGTSRFRVPVAVARPSERGRYAVAVLCDDGTVPLTALDWYVQRPAALRARGWQVYQVSARTWAERRDEEIARIASLLQSS
jgi:uncharacterized tellurite resistance protein B-like protein